MITLFVNASQIIAALAIAFSQAATSTPDKWPDSLAVTDAGKRGGFIQMKYGDDMIEALVAPNGQFVINLCSKLYCRHSEPINVKNARFVETARNLGCVIEDSGKWDCPRTDHPKAGIKYEDGSVSSADNGLTVPNLENYLK